jgi:hypothetical protein
VPGRATRTGKVRVIQNVKDFDAILQTGAPGQSKIAM